MVDAPAAEEKGKSLSGMVATLQAVAATGLLGGKARNIILTVSAYDPLLKAATNKTALEHLHGYLNKDDGHATLDSIANAVRGRKDAVLEALPEGQRTFLTDLGAKINEIFGASKDKVAGVVQDNEAWRAAAKVVKAAVGGQRPVNVTDIPTAANDEIPKPAAAQTTQVG